MVREIKLQSGEVISRPCAEHFALEKRVDDIESDLGHHKEENREDIGAIMDAMKNRLPVWATLAFGVFGALIGALSALLAR